MKLAAVISPHNIKHVRRGYLKLETCVNTVNGPVTDWIDKTPRSWKEKITVRIRPTKNRGCNRDSDRRDASRRARDRLFQGHVRVGRTGTGMIHVEAEPWDPRNTTRRLSPLLLSSRLVSFLSRSRRSRSAHIYRDRRCDVSQHWHSSRSSP